MGAKAMTSVVTVRSSATCLRPALLSTLSTVEREFTLQYLEVREQGLGFDSMSHIVNFLYSGSHCDDGKLCDVSEASTAFQERISGASSHTEWHFQYCSTPFAQ